MSNTNLPKSTMLEKIMYGFGDIGANLCWTFMAMYVTLYYTDNVGISAAVAGTMMLVARFLDGITDIIGAYLIEKIHFRAGKIRPWLMISAPLLAIGLYLSFHVPAALSVQSKTIYIFATYTFTAAIAFTIYNLAFSSILNLMSLDPDDRSNAAVVGRIVTTIGISIVSYVSPLLLAFWGGEKSTGAWSKISTLYAVLCFLIVFAMGYLIKEKERPADVKEQGDTKDSAKKEKMSVLIKAVLSTKYTWILFAIFTSFYLYFGVAGVRVYFYRDVIGNFAVYGTVSLMYSLCRLPGFAVMPYIFKKVGQKNAVMGGLVIAIASNVVMFLFPRSLAVAMTTNVTMSLGMVPLLASVFVYVANLIDYIYTTKHLRAEGFVAMTSSIGTKVGTGIGSAAVGWGLAMIGYNGAAETQSAATQSGIVFLTAGIPAILAVVLLILVFFWKLDSKKSGE